VRKACRDVRNSHQWIIRCLVCLVTGNSNSNRRRLVQRQTFSTIPSAFASTAALRSNRRCAESLDKRPLRVHARVTRRTRACRIFFNLTEHLYAVVHQRPLPGCSAIRLGLCGFLRRVHLDRMFGEDLFADFAVFYDCSTSRVCPGGESVARIPAGALPSGQPRVRRTHPRRIERAVKESILLFADGF